MRTPLQPLSIPLPSSIFLSTDNFSTCSLSTPPAGRGGRVVVGGVLVKGDLPERSEGPLDKRGRPVVFRYALPVSRVV